MAITNFDVKPFSVLPGLNAVNQGIGSAINQKRQDENKAIKVQKAQQLVKAVQSDDPEAVFEFVANNPDSADMAQQIMGFHSEVTKQSLIDTSKKILMGESDPGSAMIEHISTVLQEGGNAEQSRSMASAMIEDPSIAKNKAAMALALHAPEEYRAYREATAAPEAEAGFTLSEGQTRFDAAGNPIANVDAAGGMASIPSALTEGLSEQVASKGAAAFSSAGGGKDGIDAFIKVVDKATEQEQRALVPALLENSFPNASPAEFQELEAAAAAGVSVESGLKSARTIRTEQRRLKKAKGFQERSVALLDNILASNQVGDVTGPIEGRIDFKMFSDAEAELIADIDEAQNILTADNMDLMTGVLSESDIKLLKNLSSGALNRIRGKKRFLKDVQNMRDKLSSQLVLTADDKASLSGASKRLIFNPETGQLEPAK